MASSSPQTKKVYTAEERKELAARLDREFDEFLKESAQKSQQSERVKVDIDELAEELNANPFFRTKPFAPGEAIPQLYQNVLDWAAEDEREIQAESNKEDGNKNFKLKKYRWASDSYTCGIKAQCANHELNAILYANRAACHFRLGNYRSAYRDCVFSRKFKPDHVKAILRGAECCQHLEDYETGIRWCDAGLLLDPTDETFLDLRTKCTQNKKTKEKEARKLALREKKRRKEETDFVNAILSRGVHLDYKPDDDDDDVNSEYVSPRLLASLDSHHPSGAKVSLNSDGTITWPVMFLYPEFKQTDFIEEFHEDARFIDHLTHMFAEDAEPPAWDCGRKYTPSSIQIYFEDTENLELHKVNKNWTLKKTISHDKYLIKGGTPGFILLVKGSDYENEFVKEYTVL